MNYLNQKGTDESMQPNNNKISTRDTININNRIDDLSYSENQPGYPKIIRSLPKVFLKPIVLFTPEESNCDSSAIGLNTINFAPKSWA